jgi:hypothetical protein
MSWEAEAGPELGWEAGVWSVADAEWLLEIPARRIREALRAGGKEAAGRRLERGRGTRHVRVYRAEDVLEALGLKVF